MNREELRSRVAEKLEVSESALVWSETCGNPETIYHNIELGTVAYGSLGYWVVKK